MSALELPAEIVALIAGHLDLADLKHLRLSRGTYSRYLIPFCFHTIRFELSVNSLANLHKVCRREDLRGHVKELVSRRRSGLKPFPDFADWETSVVDCAAGDGSPTAWSAVSVGHKKELFAQYAADFCRHEP